MSQQLQPGDEIRPHAEVVSALVLDEAADAAQDPVLGQGVDIGLDGGSATQRQAGHHAPEPVIPPAARQPGAASSRHCPSSTSTSTKTKLVDPHRRRPLGQVLGEDETDPVRDVAGPTEGNTAGIAEMHVAVDDREINHLRSAPPEPFLVP